MQRNHSTASLESVTKQFEQWRATRSKKGKIPDSLWTLVAPLRGLYSDNEIASTLRINHTQLKNAVPVLSSRYQKQPSFLECPVPVSMSGGENCHVEFSGKNGSTVKISGLTSAQIQPLVLLLLGN